jgi:hypothetical protein
MQDQYDVVSWLGRTKIYCDLACWSLRMHLSSWPSNKICVIKMIFIQLNEKNVEPWSLHLAYVRFNLYKNWDIKIWQLGLHTWKPNRIWGCVIKATASPLIYLYAEELQVQDKYNSNTYPYARCLGVYSKSAWTPCPSPSLTGDLTPGNHICMNYWMINFMIC